MAKQTGLFKFTGKLDNVIGYRRNGIHFVRSMPDQVRQTSATRRASIHFGIASRRGKLIRKALTPHLDLRQDGTLVNRLNKALVQAGRNNLPGIEGFRFNRYAGIDKMFAQSPLFTHNGLLKLPAQELPQPPGATHLEIRIIAVRIDFALQRIADVETTTEIIDLRKPFSGMELPVPSSGKGTLLVVLQSRACREQNGVIHAMGDRRWMAADIVAVVTPPSPTKKGIKIKRPWKRPVYREPANGFAPRRESTLLPPAFTCQLE